MRILETVSRDFFYAARAMRRNPAFAITSLLTLTLGIGANTAIFTVVRAVLLKPLAYHDSDRLVRLSGGATLAHFEVFQAARCFSELGAFAAGIENISLAGNAQPEMLKGARHRKLPAHPRGRAGSRPQLPSRRRRVRRSFRGPDQ